MRHACRYPSKKLRNFVTLGTVLYDHFGLLDFDTGKHCTCMSSVRFSAMSSPGGSTVAGNRQFLLDGSFCPAGLLHGLWSGSVDISVKHKHASVVAVRGRTTCATEYFRLVCPSTCYSHTLAYPPSPDCQSRNQYGLMCASKRVRREKKCWLH